MESSPKLFSSPIALPAISPFIHASYTAYVVVCHNSQLEEQDERDDESLVQQMFYFLICLMQTGSASRHVGNQQDGEYDDAYHAYYHIGIHLDGVCPVAMYHQQRGTGHAAARARDVVD